MSQLRAMVVAGGLSHERDVSLRSGRRVSEALRTTGVDVYERDVDDALVRALVEDPPDAVVPLLHGAEGEDGHLRDVLAMLRVPFVGSDPAASRVAWDKPVAQTVVAAAGLATPMSVVLAHETFRELGAGGLIDLIVSSIGLPLVVKPTRGGSALGCSMVTDAAHMRTALRTCFAYGQPALVQRQIIGVEVAVGVVDTGSGPEALPAVEIVPDGGLYDYQARYTAGSTEFFAPARLDDATSAAVREVALLAHRVLGLRDLSRSDLIVDADGRPWFLEVNVAPGMTETSLFPQALAAQGHDLGQVMRRLLEVATARGAAAVRAAAPVA